MGMLLVIVAQDKASSLCRNEEFGEASNAVIIPLSYPCVPSKGEVGCEGKIEYQPSFSISPAASSFVFPGCCYQVLIKVWWLFCALWYFLKRCFFHLCSYISLWLSFGLF